MLKILTSIFLVSFLTAINVEGQVTIDTVSLVSTEKSNVLFCFNNTKLMAGNTVSDRYIVYYNSDTVFLNVLNAGTWTRKIAYIGNSMQSATLTFYKDTIWVCWKGGINNAQIKARYTKDKGNSWSSILSVSPVGKVSAPSVYASSNGKIHFVWSKESTADTTVNYNVYSKGVLLATPTVLSNLSAQGLWPSVIAIGDTVLCSWKEHPLPSKVWFRTSFNGGISWNKLPDQPTTTLLGTSKDPNLAYAYDASKKVHYVYLSYDGQNQIYLQRSTDFGLTWTNPTIISNTNKLSQFAHLECNNNGFIGVSYEQRQIGSSLFDDSKKDVGFTYSTNWGNTGSFSNDTLAYNFNRFGSVYPALSKIDENNFYLAWLTNDTIKHEIKVLERRVRFSVITALETNSAINNPSIQIYPNPFSTTATIKSKTNLIKATLTVYNILGQEVKQIQNFTGQTINLHRDNLPSGLYFIKLMEGKKIITCNKILITQ